MNGLYTLIKPLHSGLRQLQVGNFSVKPREQTATADRRLNSMAIAKELEIKVVGVIRVALSRDICFSRGRCGV